VGGVLIVVTVRVQINHQGLRRGEVWDLALTDDLSARLDTRAVVELHRRTVTEVAGNGGESGVHTPRLRHLPMGG
jgi:hypothetical protein